MTDEIALRLEVDRAARAQALVNDELLADAFAKLRTEYQAAWLNTGARDTDARERLWQGLKVVEKVEDHLKRIISDGAVARREIQQLEQMGR